MKILFTKAFTKQYWKCSTILRERIDSAIEIFRKDPFTQSLHNHPLHGTMKGQRAISAGFDLRLIFVERDGYAVVLMLAVGSHQDVY